MIVYHLETYNTDRAHLYSVSLYKSSKISGNFNRDIRQREPEKGRIDCGVFKRTNYGKEKLGHVLEFRAEEKIW